MSRGLVFALMLVLPLGSACRHRGPAGGDLVFQAEGSVTVKIVNNNALDVVMYVAHDGYRDRLGQVTSSTSTNFEVRFRTLGAGREFQLLADPVGSRDPIRSETIHPQAGQLITWTLESDFKRSTVTIF